MPNIEMAGAMGASSAIIFTLENKEHNRNIDDDDEVYYCFYYSLFLECAPH